MKVLRLPSIVMSSWRWLFSNGGQGNHQILPFSRKNMSGILIKIVGLPNFCKNMVGCNWEKNQCRRWLEGLLRPKSSTHFSDSHFTHHSHQIHNFYRNKWVSAYSIWIVMPPWCSIVIVVWGYKCQLFNQKKSATVVSTNLWWFNHTWLIASQCMAFICLHHQSSAKQTSHHSKALPC